MKLNYFSSGPRERVLKHLLDSGFDIKNVYVTNPKKWPRAQKTIELAKANGIPVNIVNRRDLVDLGKTLKGEVCISVGFGYIFPKEFLQSIEVCLNVHGSLLPKYSGARTLNWVIENGETESGVTIHIVDEGIDTGPIVLQRGFSLSPFETGKSLYRKTLEFEPQVVSDALQIFDERGFDASVPQKMAKVVQFPNRIPEHSEIDPSRSLNDLYNQIRAADSNDYPAYFWFKGEKVCVKLWRPDKDDTDIDLI